MKLSGAIVLLLSILGAAVGFTDLLRAGTNAARGAISTGNSFLGVGFGGLPRWPAGPLPAPASTPRPNPALPAVLTSPPGNPVRPVEPSRAPPAPEPQTQPTRSPAVVQSLKDAAEALGGSAPLVGGAIASARSAANTASSMGDTALAQVNNAISLSSFMASLLNNPWVQWLAGLIYRWSGTVQSLMSQLPIPRLF